MPPLDRRLHAFRPDLADERLAGLVEAREFVPGRARGVLRPWADLRPRPDESAALDTQLLRGEVVDAFEERDGWAWVQSRRDGYVGYVRADALGPEAAPATHEVSALLAPRLAAPDVKAPTLELLPLGARVALGALEGEWREVAGGGWVPAAHVVALGAAPQEAVGTASRFLGLPYRWGGKTALGLDCSALVQIALQAAGHECPRDSDQQAATLGAQIAPDAPRRRGDLLFWPGHVALALDAQRVVHATAHGMRVRVEEAEVVMARVRREKGRGLLSLRRLEDASGERVHEPVVGVP